VLPLVLNETLAILRYISGCVFSAGEGRVRQIIVDHTLDAAATLGSDCRLLRDLASDCQFPLLGLDRACRLATPLDRLSASEAAWQGVHQGVETLRICGIGRQMLHVLHHVHLEALAFLHYLLLLGWAWLPALVALVDGILDAAAALGSNSRRARDLTVDL